MAIDGKARGARRCTKRIGSKKCGNWSEVDSDRCGLHPRTAKPAQPAQLQPVTLEAVPPEPIGQMLGNTNVDEAISSATNSAAVVDAEAEQRQRTERVRRAFAKLLRDAGAKRPPEPSPPEPLHAPLLTPAA